MIVGGPNQSIEIIAEGNISFPIRESCVTLLGSYSLFPCGSC